MKAESKSKSAKITIYAPGNRHVPGREAFYRNTRQSRLSVVIAWAGMWMEEYHV